MRYDDLKSFLTIAIFTLAIFLIGAGGIISGFRRRAKKDELFRQQDWRLPSIISLFAILLVTVLGIIGYVIYFNYILRIPMTVNIGGIEILCLIIFSYAILAGWLQWKRSIQATKVNNAIENPQGDIQIPLITAEDPVIGSWHCASEEIKATFNGDGTFDLVSLDRAGQDLSYIGGKAYTNGRGLYALHKERERRSKEETVTVAGLYQLFGLREKRLYDLYNKKYVHVKDFDTPREDSGMVAQADYPRNPEDEVEQSSGVAWLKLSIALIALVGISIVLFIALIVIIPLLPPLVDPLHLFVCSTAVLTAFFLSILIFILGYYTTPFFMDEMLFSDTTGKRVDAEMHGWYHAVYYNLKPEDRRSRFIFCFVYLLPPMAILGGIMLTIGVLSLGIFGPLLGFSLEEILAGAALWLGMVVAGIVIKNALIKKFTQDGTLGGINPIASRAEYNGEVINKKTR